MMKHAIKKTGVFTSGGDAPGMNAAIRAVVRAAVYNDVEVKGIISGYKGMMDSNFVDLNARSVSNIIHRGGTILKTARCKEFMHIKGREKAYYNLIKEGIDTLVAIGGDGTFKGALEFMKEHPDIRIIGIPGTIDNDLSGTDFTLGFDTAVNTAIEAIDKIRDTAASHDRLFLIEVMGRDSGCIALYSGIAGGAEAILMPETRMSIHELSQVLKEGEKNKKTSFIVVVAEHDEEGGAAEIAEKLKKENSRHEIKVTVLGHIQRGGSPTCSDRILGSRLGVAAVESLLNGESGKMVGVINNKIALTPFEEATTEDFSPDKDLLRYAEILAC
jgi:6-phosphofructokinase 1